MRPSRGTLAALAGLLALIFASVFGLVSASGARSASNGVFERTWLEGRLMETLIRVRAQHGLPWLRPSVELSAAARQHTTEMARDGYFSHNGEEGSYARRLSQYYPRSRRRFWRVGEILAWGSPSISADTAVTLWLRSPEHRAALLSGAWRDVGISAMHSNNAPGVFQGLDVTVITIDFGAH